MPYTRYCSLSHTLRLQSFTSFKTWIEIDINYTFIPLKQQSYWGYSGFDWNGFLTLNFNPINAKRREQSTPE